MNEKENLKKEISVIFESMIKENNEFWQKNFQDQQ